MNLTKNLTLLLLLATAVIPSFSQSLAYKTLLEGLYDENFPVVRPAQIVDLTNYQVLDAREKTEFEVSHLPGAKWVGYESFSLEGVKSLDKKKPVLIYCTVGARSEEIGKKMREAGFVRVYNLYGGIIHWANENKALEVNGTPTKKVHTYSKSWGIWLTNGEKVY
jgi:rhodanese-related sulfurtransferase